MFVLIATLFPWGNDNATDSSAGAEPEQSPATTDEQIAQLLKKYEFSERHMGVDIKISLYSRDRASAILASKAAFGRIAEIEAVSSDYRGDSEVMTLVRSAKPGAPTPVSEELWSLLILSKSLSRQTGGAFDVTVGPLVRRWRQARIKRTLPDPEKLATAREQSGDRSLTLNPDRNTVTFAVPKMRLDFGGIGKGYAGDEARKTLATLGVTRVLLDMGGDLVLGDPPPNRKGWRVAIASLTDPDTRSPGVLSLNNCGVATSGDVYQFVEIEGVRYSHIVDPRTGLGLTRRIATTVIAPTGAEADALASAFCVMGPKRTLDWIRCRDGIEAFLLTIEAGEEVRHRSPGFPEPKPIGE